jgi:hypothetical protein
MLRALWFWLVHAALANPRAQVRSVDHIHRLSAELRRCYHVEREPASAASASGTFVLFAPLAGLLLASGLSLHIGALSACACAGTAGWASSHSSQPKQQSPGAKIVAEAEVVQRRRRRTGNARA